MEFLRENFAYLHNELELLHEDLQDLDVRMMALEADFGFIRLEGADIRSILRGILSASAA